MKNLELYVQEAQIWRGRHPRESVCLVDRPKVCGTGFVPSTKLMPAWILVEDAAVVARRLRAKDR